jgi:lysozyme family protein
MPFDDMYKHTKRFEGGYVNDSSDAGGETFHGITRVSFPRWPGWKDIDEAKAALDTPKINPKKAERVAVDRYIAAHYPEIFDNIRAFYISEFWNKVPSALPDRLRQKVCDTGINAGLSRAFLLLQLAVNRMGKNLNVDGKIGPITLKAVSLANEDALLNAYSACQAAYYTDLAKRKPEYQKFLKAWLSRAAWIPGVTK